MTPQQMMLYGIPSPWPVAQLRTHKYMYYEEEEEEEEKKTWNSWSGKRLVTFDTSRSFSTQGRRVFVFRVLSKCDFPNVGSHSRGHI